MIKDGAGSQLVDQGFFDTPCLSPQVEGTIGIN